MKLAEGTTSNGKRYAHKCDVLIGGMETIGSAERGTDIDQMKERLFGIIQAMDPKADMRKLERIFDKFNKIFKGNLDSMDKELNRKEQELGISI